VPLPGHHKTHGHHKTSRASQDCQLLKKKLKDISRILSRNFVRFQMSSTHTRKGNGPKVYTSKFVYFLIGSALTMLGLFRVLSSRHALEVQNLRQSLQRSVEVRLHGLLYTVVDFDNTSFVESLLS
jgi:hypothetical protein